MTHTVTVYAKFDGVSFTDITRLSATSYVLAGGEERFITMSPGASDNTGFTPFTIELDYRDDEALLDGMNPESPYYGLIGPGTEIMVQKNGEIRGVAEITTMEPTWDSASDMVVVAIKAAGVRRRLEGERDQPLASVAVRTIGASSNTNRISYWPCEEESGATSIFSHDGQQAPPWLVNEGAISFGADTESASSARLIRFGTDGQISFHPAPYVTTGNTIVMNLFRLPADGLAAGALIMRIWVNQGTITHLDLKFNTAGAWALLWEAWNQGTLIDGGLCGPTDWVNWISEGAECQHRLSMTQNGANVDFRHEIVRCGTDTGGVIGGVFDTLVGQTLGIVTRITAAMSDCNGMSFGQLAIGKSLTAFQNYIGLTNGTTGLQGYIAETAGRRLERLAGEEGISLFVDGGSNPSADTALMGVQGPGLIMKLMQDCADTDGGLLYDDPQDIRLVYKPRVGLYNQVPLSLSNAHLSAPFHPVVDDTIMNDVKVQRVGGSTGTYTIPDGDRQHWTTQPPPLGSNRKPGQVDLSLAADDQIDNHAAWLAHVNSWRAKRYAAVELETDRTAFSAGDVNTVEAIEIGSLVALDTTTARRWVTYNEERILVRGWTERLNQNLHQFTLNAIHADPWEVDVTDAGDIRLVAAINDSDTSITVAPMDGFRWSTSDPFHIQIDGDPMTVTAVTDNTPTFVGASAAASVSDGGTTAPALPAGLAARDLMVVWATTRNSGVGTVDLPAGWLDLIDPFGNCRLIYRYYVSGDAAPNITSTGDAAGDTNIARMFAFRGLSHGLASGPMADPSAGYAQLNGSAANILYPRLRIEPTRASPAPTALGFLWKADDFTALSTPSGFTQMSADASTTGNDAGIGAYYDLTGVQAVSGTVTVTGGAAAISRAITLALRPTQTLTVTRGIAGVAASHLVNESVTAWRLGVNAL